MEFTHRSLVDVADLGDGPTASEIGKLCSLNAGCTHVSHCATAECLHVTLLGRMQLLDANLEVSILDTRAGMSR
jgi:hypothetical protein